MDPEMGSYEDNRTYKARELYILSDKIEELHRTNEELKRAKDEAVQSWLDSRPLIDELERLKTDVANAKEQSENTLVEKMESELMAINSSIRAKKEEELRSRNEINEMTRVSESLREEMERVKLEVNEAKRARTKMKMVIKMRRQTLRTLKLTLRAVRLETEAYRASGEAAIERINRGKILPDNTATIELTQEDYFALTRRAKEETSLADWRVVVATEQKQAAEESRDLALQRLNDLTQNGGSMRNERNEKISAAQSPFPKAQTADRGIKNIVNRRVYRKKRSIFTKIKSFLARKMKYLLG